MGSLGGITGNPAAQLARQQLEAKSGQPRAAHAYLDPGSPEIPGDDVLISAVLDVGAAAEATPEHDEVGPHVPQNQSAQQYSAAPFVTAYGVPLSSGPAAIEEEASAPGAVAGTRQGHAPADRGTRTTLPASRPGARWFLIILAAVATIMAIFVWTAGSGK